MHLREVLRVGALMLAALFPTVGCGDSFRSTPAGVESSPPGRSAVVLAHAPDTCSIGQFGPVTYRADSAEGMDIHFVPDDVSIGVPGIKLQFAQTVRVGGSEYLLVGSIDASDDFHLYRYADTTGDGVPDQSSEVQLFSSLGDPMFVTSVAMAADGSFFCLDRRCQDICVAIDTDSDGWGDTLQASPFARSQDFPAMLDARRVSGPASVDGVFVLGLMDVAGQDELGELPAWILTDSDSDGAADLLTVVESRRARIGAYDHIPFDGQTAVSVFGFGYPSGATAEVWLLDSGGNDVQLLGSAVLADDQPTSVSLSSALVEGQVVSIRLAGGGAASQTAHVVSDAPQVHRCTPYMTEAGVAAPVTLKGANLTATMLVFYLEGGEGTPIPLAFSLVDSETATVTLPGGLDPTAITFWALAAGQSPAVDEPLSMASLSVVHPDPN